MKFNMAKKVPPQDDLEMNQMAQAELLRLQRQYRIMEGDRVSYTDEMKFILEKQRKIIITLENEKDELITNLNTSKSVCIEVIDKTQTKQLFILLDHQNELDEQIKTERSQLVELETQIRKVEHEVLSLRKKDVNDLRLLEQILTSARNIELLENRLHVATVKLNRILTGNASLRQEIDHLLKERTHFNQLYQLLIGRLTLGKKTMLDLIEQATLAYDQREEAQAKLQALKERDRADLLFHSQEMRELQRRFDHDSKLQDFLGVKGQKRIMADLEAKEEQKKQQQKEANEQLITTYNYNLDKIREFSGENDVDRLVAQFIKQEEENFTLFNYVNELNNELEILQEQTNGLMLNVDEQRNVNKERALQQQETIQSLSLVLEDKVNQAKQALERQNHNSKILSNLLLEIQNLFSVARCDASPILQLLGQKGCVSTYNVILFLGMIKRQIDELLRSIYPEDIIVPVKDTVQMTPPKDDKLSKNKI